LRRAVTFERLAPAGEPASAHELLAEVRPRERAPADRPFVYVNFVATIDGRAARAELGLEPDPPAVLISRGLDLPWDAGLFAAPEQPVLVYTGARGTAPDVAAQVEVVRLEVPSPAAVLADLRRRGIRALGCEGGPLLFGSLVADDLVDELFFTLVPMLTGEDAAPRIVEGGDLPVHVRAAPLWVLRAGDELFLRYGLSGAPSDRTV
jgi:riboflavin biosynthesis pyrimidine reductase